MALIKINDVELPNPSEFSVTQSDLDSDATMRNSEGYLIRDRVRAGVYRIDVSWEGLTHSDYLTVVNALAPAKFTVDFWDMNSASRKTAQMYAGDRKSKLVFKSGNRAVISLSCALIEY